MSAYEEFQAAVARVRAQGSFAWYVHINPTFLKQLEAELGPLTPASQPNQFFLDGLLINVVNNPEIPPEDETLQASGTHRSIPTEQPPGAGLE